MRNAATAARDESAAASGARRGAAQVVRALTRAGIDTWFGIPGGAISPINDALLDEPGATVLVTRHEAEAVFAACGHWLASQRMAAVFVTSGPGATNALTGLASAFCDGIPLVLLIGEVPRPLQGRGALQDGSSHQLNIAAVARSLAKASWEAVDAQALPMLIARAVRTATSGRPGPVVLTLPLDVQLAEARDCVVEEAVLPAPLPPPAAVERLVAIARASQRGAILAGAGMRAGDGPAALRAFAEAAQLPVLTTPKGKAVFPETHPLALGVFGIGGHPSGREYLDGGLDTLIALGTSLGDLSTEGWSRSLVPSRALVHVDIDGAVIGRHYAADLAVAAPAAPLLRAAAARLEPRGPAAVHGVRCFTDPSTTGDGAEQRISPARALWELQRVLPADTRYAIDSGEHFLFAAHYLTLTEPDAFLAMTGLGSMGSSLGVALGAQLADRARPTAVIMGDGGFGMIATQIADAVAARLPLVICVFNDRRLAMCELGHLNVYGRTPSYETPDIDVAQVARGLGAEALVVDHTGEIEAQAAQFRRAAGPLVVDVRIDRSFQLPKKDRIGALGRAADKPAR